MPEGDTVYKVAARLRPLLLEQRLRSLRTRGGREVRCPDPRVVEIDSRGKHMLVRLADGPTLRVHLGMKGTWHRYAPGEPWQRSAAGASLVLETARDVVVCFRAQAVELLDPRRAEQHPTLAQLGPDLLAEQLDLGQVVARARARGGELGVLLQDQRVAAGVGNVYRCELMFLRRLHPRQDVSALSDDALRELYAEARRLMQANLEDRPRTTRTQPGSRHHVYRRAGRPCFRCHTPIAQHRQGELARVTYWCPGCQPASSALPAGGERGTREG